MERSSHVSGGICTLLTMALLYLLVIEVIVCTQPDHHLEAVPLVHFIGSFTALSGRMWGAAPFHLQ